MVVNALSSDTYGQMMCVYGSTRKEFFGVDSLPGLAGFNRVDAATTEGFSEASMGAFTYLIKKRDGAVPSMKLPAVGSADIRLRSQPDVAKFFMKTGLGAEYSGERYPVGAISMFSNNLISAQYTPVEYTHTSAVPLSTLPNMLQDGQFTGFQPLFALNFDIRAFEDTTAYLGEGSVASEDPRLGKPGYYTDPTNAYYYYQESDEKAFAMAPFRFWFEALEENPVQVDADTGRAAYRTQGGDLIYSNVAKDLPVVPLLSIAQLEDAPLGRDYQHYAYQFKNWAGTHAMEDGEAPPLGAPGRRNMAPEFNRAVGNGIAHPLIAADSIWDGAYAVDKSYTLNDLLFDSYFFSGVADREGAFFETTEDADRILSDIIDGSQKFSNSNYNLVVPAGMDSADVGNILQSSGTASGADPFELLAAFIEVVGAFNVNSTSVDAWAAMLSSLRGQVIQYEDLNPLSSEYKETSDADRSPLMGQSLPSGIAAESASNPLDATTALWSGYRALSDTKIREFAEALVSEVKARGPFLSLSQFVNREVSTRSPYNQKGALQAAIDATQLNTKSDDASFDTILDNRFNSNPSALDASGLAAAGFEFPEALEGDLNEGARGAITQAQVLRPMAPLLSARSDTFVIRSYGDVQVQGATVSKVWCEAIVQRRSGYVSGGEANDPEAWEIPSVGGIADLFGRKFEVLSFRWLNEDEI
jgi:hypothetical protein